MVLTSPIIEWTLVNKTNPEREFHCYAHSRTNFEDRGQCVRKFCFLHPVPMINSPEVRLYP